MLISYERDGYCTITILNNFCNNYSELSGPIVYMRQSHRIFFVIARVCGSRHRVCTGLQEVEDKVSNRSASCQPGIFLHTVQTVLP